VSLAERLWSLFVLVAIGKALFSLASLAPTTPEDRRDQEK
jgi:hypothetical protein